MSRIDDNGDALVDHVESWWYASGRKLDYSYDCGNDGVPDLTIAYYYGRSGKLVWEARDENADGDYDYLIAYSHDAAGNLIAVINDYDADGVGDDVARYTYDDDGNLVGYERDRENDGIADLVHVHIWRNGLLVRTESSSKVDPIVKTAKRPFLRCDGSFLD